MSDNDSLVSFAEIEALIAQLPSGDDEVAAEVQSKLPEGAGKLGEYAVWLARWQSNVKPEMRRPRAVFFAASYEPNPQKELTEKTVQAYSSEKHLVYKLCQSIDCDLRAYELDLDNASAVPGESQAAMTEEECGRAIAYGMMAVEPGVHALALGTISPSAVIASDALNSDKSPLELLRFYGGYDTAAVLGAMLAARLARVPVIFSGAVAEFAYAVLQKAGSGLADHCMKSDRTIADDDNAELLARLSDLKLAASLI